MWRAGNKRRYVPVPKKRFCINRLTPNDPYMDRTAPLTSKRCILYIYSTNIGTEYFKHALNSPFFPSKYSLFHNVNLFGSCIIHILCTGCAKIKKNNSGAKGLIRWRQEFRWFKKLFAYYERVYVTIHCK